MKRIILLCFLFTTALTIAAGCVLESKKCDCNLLNNRFLKKKSITIGNDIEMSELLWSAVFFHRFK